MVAVGRLAVINARNRAMTALDFLPVTLHKENSPAMEVICQRYYQNIEQFLVPVIIAKIPIPQTPVVEIPVPDLPGCFRFPAILTPERHHETVLMRVPHQAKSPPSLHL